MAARAVTSRGRASRVNAGAARAAPALPEMAEGDSAFASFEALTRRVLAAPKPSVPVGYLVVTKTDSGGGERVKVPQGLDRKRATAWARERLREEFHGRSGRVYLSDRESLYVRGTS